MENPKRHRSRLTRRNKSKESIEVITISSTSSSSEDEETDSERKRNTKSIENLSFEGRTFIDFESDNSIPNLTVKTFLRDCLHHPKILFHKDFQFFRDYLKELNRPQYEKLFFSLRSNAPFIENHEDNTFCVDRCDKKWLEKLKSRVQDPNNEKTYFWASIAPIKRRFDLGLVIFKWESFPMSVTFITAYLECCMSVRLSAADEDNSQDDYLANFLQLFSQEENLEVEERYKDAVDASNERKLSNKVEPSRTDLLYLFRRQPKYPISSSSSSSSSSDTSSEDSDSSCLSEYKGYYTKGHRKTKRRKVVKKKRNFKSSSLSSSSASSLSSVPYSQRRNTTRRIIGKPLPTTIKLNGITKWPFLPREIRIILDKLPTLKQSNILTEAESLQIEGPTPTVKTSPCPSASLPSSIVPKLEEIVQKDYSPIPEGAKTEEILQKQAPFKLEVNKSIIFEDAFNNNTKWDVSLVPEVHSTIKLNEEPFDVSAKIEIKLATDPVKSESSSVINHKVNGNILEVKLSQNKVNNNKRKRKINFECEICWFGKTFPSQKSLDLHMNNMHSSITRGLVSCKCGMRFKKANLECHQRLCEEIIRNF